MIANLPTTRSSRREENQNPEKGRREINELERGCVGVGDQPQRVDFPATQSAAADAPTPHTAALREHEGSQSVLTSAAEKSDDWLLWQLADSAFPTGGFAHSGGLEAACQNGEVRNRSELASFFETSLHQLGHAALPFVIAAHCEPVRLTELDLLCDAFTTNHVANRASRLQGRALLASVQRIFGSNGFEQGQPQSDNAAAAKNHSPVQPPCAHYAPVFGAITHQLDVRREDAANLFFFVHLRGLISSAVRLGIVGPMEAQALQHGLAPRAREILSQCENLAVTDIAQTTPLLEIWQGTQDRLYSRLFQS